MLSDATVVAPSFTADVAGDYVVSLVVNDGAVDSVPAQLTISAKPHTLPVAQLQGRDTFCGSGTCVTAPYPVRVNDTMFFDGSKSRATDSKMLTYHWTIKDPSGADVPPIQVSANDWSQVKFNITATGVYSATLIVNDGFNDSAPASSSFTAYTADRGPPIADAGSDQTVGVGDTVQLDARKSSPQPGSGGGDALTLNWTLVSAPPGSNVAISPTLWQPTFVADVAGAYDFKLQVFDGRQWSNTASVTITAIVRPQVSFDESDTSMATGATVVIHAVATEANATLSYAWTIKSQPASGAGTLSSATVIQPSFTASVDGTYDLELTVTDNNGASTTKDITYLARVPTATIQAQQSSSSVGQTLHFLAVPTVSGTSLDFNWAVSGVAATVISDSYSRGFTVVANAAGTLTVTLTIHDNNGGHAFTTSLEVPIN
jgi:hypothetical protein